MSHLCPCLVFSCLLPWQVSSNFSVTKEANGVCQQEVVAILFWNGREMLLWTQHRGSIFAFDMCFTSQVLGEDIGRMAKAVQADGGSRFTPRARLSAEPGAGKRVQDHRRGLPRGLLSLKTSTKAKLQHISCLVNAGKSYPRTYRFTYCPTANASSGASKSRAAEGSKSLHGAVTVFYCTHGKAAGNAGP